MQHTQKREGTWNAMVDMQCKLEEEEETWQGSPPYSNPFSLGSLVHYQASHRINAERRSFCFSFLLPLQLILYLYVAKLWHRQAAGQSGILPGFLSN